MRFFFVCLFVFSEKRKRASGPMETEEHPLPEPPALVVLLEILLFGHCLC